MDRTLRKPNLLIWNEEYMAIDHDLSLPQLLESCIGDINQSNFSRFYNNERLRSHLLIPFLKKQRAKERMAPKFEDFAYTLERFNPKGLEGLNGQLADW